MQSATINQKPQPSPIFDAKLWRDGWRIYLRMMALLRPHWFISVCTIVCTILATAFALIVPSLLQWVVDVGVHTGRFTDLLLVSAAILGVSILRGLAAYGQGYYSQAVSNEVAYDLRNQLYNHLQSLSFSFHDDSETGQLMSRASADVEAVRNFFPFGLFRAITAIVTFGAVAILLLRLDIYLALVTLISVPIILVISVLVIRRLRPIWLRVQDGVGELSTIMQESLAGVRVVKSFAREEFEINKYEKQNLALRELNMSAMRLAAWNQPLLILVLNIIAVVVLWIGGIAVINHHLTLGTLVAATQYVFLLTTPVRSFGYMINWFVRGVSGGTRIFAVLDTPSEIKDAPDAYVLQRARGYVTFEQVTFAYSNGIEVLHT